MLDHANENIKRILEENLTTEEIGTLAEFFREEVLETIDTVEELKSIIDLNSITELLTDTFKYTCDNNPDKLSELLLTANRTVEVVKKLFYRHRNVLGQLSRILDEEEFKYVTQFLCIYTESNEITLEEYLSFSIQCTTLQEVYEVVKEMFLDELTQIEKEDFANPFWQIGLQCCQLQSVRCINF